MANAPHGSELPTTSYAVLGLLTFGEMSGYDLKQFADRSICHFFWSPASSQIYAELRRLASLGYVTEREVAQERRPDKRLYRITPEGEGVLGDWLGAPGVEPDVHKSTLQLRLFFGAMVPHGTLIAQLEEHRRQMLRVLAQFEETEQRISSDDKFFFAYLSLRSGLAHARASLQWVEESLEILKRRTTSPPWDDTE